MKNNKLQPWVKYLSLAVLLFSLFMSIKQCSKNKSSLDDVNALVELKEQEANVYKTESEYWAAETQKALTNMASLEAVYGTEIKRLKKELKIKPKRITEIVEVYIEGRDTIILEKVKDNVVLVDTSTEKTGSYVFEDQWNYFSAWFVGENIGLDYSVSDSISFVSTYEKQGLFKPRKQIIRAISYNPAVKVVGLNAVEVVPRIKRFSVGPMVGVGVDKDFDFMPFIGVGAAYGLIRF